MTLDEANDLFKDSLPMGETRRVATRNGIAFMGQKTHPGDQNIWHGYPVEWSRIDQSIIDRWRGEGKIRNRDIDKLNTRKKIDEASWKGW